MSSQKVHDKIDLAREELSEIEKRAYAASTPEELEWCRTALIEMMGSMRKSLDIIDRV